MDRVTKNRIQAVLDDSLIIDWSRSYLEIFVVPEVKTCLYSLEESTPENDLVMVTTYSFRKEEFRLRIVEQVLADRWLIRIRSWLIALAPWPSIHRVSRKEWYDGFNRFDFEYYSIDLFFHDTSSIKDFEIAAKRIYEEELVVRLSEISGVDLGKFEGYFYEEGKENPKVFV